MIDPYGDTIFNHLQVRDLLDEWDRLARFATSDPEKKALAGVKQLAEHCLEAPHRYLRFYGD